ncbi:hypothetical protein HK105_207459 [Polyrhizophydium stewartii]|uniref:NADH-cytochrome b5 reductase n=1 Tax=Polyrhizophydium stewartii TaxID=2732419 RepID=A0ABR4N0I5_9FUNG
MFEPHHLPLALGAVVAVGALVATNVFMLSDVKKTPKPVEASPTAFREAPVVSVARESGDTCRLRVAAKVANAMPPNTGIFHVIVKDDSCQIARPYSPISHSENHIELLVKRYELGTVSRHIHSLAPGDKMHIRGPLLTLPYKQNLVERMGMIAGGTGIAPMLQLINRILDDPLDLTHISLVYASRTPEDIIAKADLDRLQQAHPEQLSITYLADRPSAAAVPQDVHIGPISASVLAKALPAPTRTDPQARQKPERAKFPLAVLVCGPEGMITAVAGPRIAEDVPGPLGGILKEMGYADQQVVKL